LSAAGSSSAGLSSPSAGPVLYDQFGNEATANPYDITSQDFEASLDAADSEAADDFTIQAGLIWTIDAIDVDGEYSSRDGETPVPAGFNVRFYANDPATNLPGTPPGVERLNQSYTSLGESPGDVQITLDPPLTLAAGTWWVPSRPASTTAPRPTRASGSGTTAESRRTRARPGVIPATSGT
jgi:hypothetical protein